MIMIDFDTVYKFQFSEPSYIVSEDSGVVNVCLELIDHTLIEDVFIQVTAAATLEDTDGCKFSKVAKLRG